MSKLFTVEPENTIFGKSRGQKIPKNMSYTFSSALHFCMEDKMALKGVHLKFFHLIPFCCALDLSRNISFQPSENPKI